MFAEDKTHAASARPEDRDTVLYTAWADAPIGVPDGAQPADGSALESAAMLDLRQLAVPNSDAGVDPRTGQAPIEQPLPYFHTTGRQLRHRLVTAESISELQAEEKPGFWQRLFRRK